MQRRKRRRSDRAGRPAMRSPGRPPATGRAEQQRFWKAIARGLSSEDAAVSCGVSPPVGGRWFREGGGMPPISLAPRSARYLSFAEREEIAIRRAQGAGVRDIARRLRRAPSTVSRELRRNAATRSGGLAYRASTAQWHSARRATRPKIAKLAANDRLRSYVQDRLAGTMMAEDGTPVPGPNVGSWSGRRYGRRQDRHWATSWSPQQIAHRLRIAYPDDDSMRVSHEAIYQALYIQGRGALRRELTACLRTGRALRVPRARRRGRGKEFVGPDIMISERPAEAEDRAVPGHWEGDLIIGLGSSAIGTLVERTTRFTMLLHLPRMAERGRLRVKNGLALAGHGAEAVRDAITSTITALPDQLRRSLTWDQGAEMAQHAQLRLDTGLHVFFCDPRSPWQRGTTRRAADHRTEVGDLNVAGYNARALVTRWWPVVRRQLRPPVAGEWNGEAPCLDVGRGGRRRLFLCRGSQGLRAPTGHRGRPPAHRNPGDAGHACVPGGQPGAELAARVTRTSRLPQGAGTEWGPRRA